VNSRCDQDFADTILGVPWSRSCLLLRFCFPIAIIAPARFEASKFGKIEISQKTYVK
jgi:hypothetical protein